MTKKEKIWLSVTGFIAFSVIFLGSAGTVLGGGRVNETNRYSDATATSTLTYLATTNTASSTIKAELIGSESSDLNICATASSSSATLLWQLYFSLDESSTAQTWFGEDGITVNSAISVTHSAYPPIHQWALATTTTNYLCKNIEISPTRAKWVRVEFKAIGANASVWRQITAQPGS